MATAHIILFWVIVVRYLLVAANCFVDGKKEWKSLFYQTIMHLVLILLLINPYLKWIICKN